METYTTKFFAAANTEDGFFSLFDNIFQPDVLKRIYILKGGPGTGKSTLMKNVGFAAEANGYKTEYYYCSSDTKSLDGVLIPSLGIAVIDGTAPHMTDPVYPGAVERIVNLGEAFDFDSLEKRREEILALVAEKKSLYRTAYRYLFTAGRMLRETEELAEPAFLFHKADAAITRLVASLRHRRRGKTVIRYQSALGVHGAVTLGTLRNRAAKKIAVTDKFGLGYLLMSRLRALLEQEETAMIACPTPLMRSRTECLFIEGEDVLIEVTDEATAASYDKVLNIGRFYVRERLSEHRGRLRFSEKCAESLLAGALETLAKSGETHRKLEEIYVSAMDFGKVDVMKNAIISEIFANNM